MPAKDGVLAKTGADAIFLCTNGCGRYVRPKRMPAHIAMELGKQLYGEDAVVIINTGRGICASCRRYPSTLTSAQKSEEQLAAEQAKKDKLAADRLEAAQRAAETIARQRISRQASRVRRVSMGQSMVRI